MIEIPKSEYIFQGDQITVVLPFWPERITQTAAQAALHALILSNFC